MHSQIHVLVNTISNVMHAVLPPKIGESKAPRTMCSSAIKWQLFNGNFSRIGQSVRVLGCHAVLRNGCTMARSNAESPGR